MTNATTLAIRIEAYQATPGPTIKPDRRAGSLTHQDYSSFRIRTCQVTLEEGTYIIIHNTKERSSNCEFQLRVASNFQLELKELN